MQKAPSGTQSIKQKKLKLAEHDLESAYRLFDNPSMRLGLSYKDFLLTMAQYPKIIEKILNAQIQGIDTQEPLTVLMDGQDLTLLGSKDITVMRTLLDKYPHKLKGYDLIYCAKTFPDLALEIFNNTFLCTKLSGRQLAELGSLNKVISRKIKETPELWERITNNPHVDGLIQSYSEQKDKGELTPQEYLFKVMPLLKEDKTMINVGVLCQNNPMLADELVKEGFLDKLNGEDLSYFVQFHPAIIDIVFKTPKLLNLLEGNDFKRLGLNSEKAAKKILESKELMQKSGPHVWSQLASKYPFFYKEFMGAFDLSVQIYLRAKKEHEESPATTPAPEKGELMRFGCEFLIELAKNIGPKFAEYLYDQIAVKKNPVYRYVFEVDGPHDLLDIDDIMSQMKSALKNNGVKDPEELQFQMMMAAQSLLLKNNQLRHMTHVFMSTLGGLSENLGLKMIDDLISHPQDLKELDGNNIQAIAGKHPKVIMKILKSEVILDKLSSAHLAGFASVNPKILDYIWSQPELKNQIINHFNIPKLAGKSINIITDAAEHNGYLDQIIDAAKKEQGKGKGKGEKDIPRGYTAYLYNILYGRAEIIKGIKEVLKDELSNQANEKEVQTFQPIVPTPFNGSFTSFIEKDVSSEESVITDSNTKSKDKQAAHL